MDYNKSKAQWRADNNMSGGYPDMGDNGPRKIFGKVSSGSNKDGLKGGNLYGKTSDGKALGAVGGAMGANGYPNPPRQSMASGKAVKPTAMKLGGGTVKAQMQPRGAGPKSIRGGDGDS